MRDRLLAYDDKISRHVTCPLAMGAVRHDPGSWVDDAIYFHSNGFRPVLTGGLHNSDQLQIGIKSAIEKRPQIRFALFLHWSELIRNEIPDSIREYLDEIYIAVDSMLSASEANSLRVRYSPRWVLIPRLGLNWKKLITEVLLPSKRGMITLLAPEHDSPDGPFLNCDELLLNIQEIQIDHPLVEIRPAQHEWFVPTELKPWRMPSRDRRSVQLLYGGSDRSSLSSAGMSTVSFIIPFLWSGNSLVLEYLKKSLESCLRTTDRIYAQSEFLRAEYIVVCDRADTTAEFSIDEFLQCLDSRVANSLTWLEAPRFDSNLNWRAGWIRNIGVEYSRANSSDYLIFLDADCEISDTALVATEIVSSQHVLLFTSLLQPSSKSLSKQETDPFQICSSRLLIIRRSLFENLGGFSDAFYRYGCEDNFLLWQAAEFIRRGLPMRLGALPLWATRHLRDHSSEDDLLEKMIRIRRSASLCYRMTLDPRVHRHFFVSLGSHSMMVAVRFILKRLATEVSLRWILGPFVFFLTVLQTREPRRYLIGIWESFVWTLRSPIQRIASQSWRVNLVKHAWRQHGWKIKHASLWPIRRARTVWGHTKIASEKMVIAIQASNWGWNIFGWRIQVFMSRLFAHVIRISVIAFTSINHLLRQIPWLIRVGFVRLYGTTRWLLGSYVVRFFGVWVSKPAIDRILVPLWRGILFVFHFIRKNWWRVKQALYFPFRWMRSNAWRVREFARWIWGQRWRVPVFFGRIWARLWFIPVGIERIKRKIGLSRSERGQK